MPEANGFDIIVCTYNNASLLQRCLEHLARLTGPPGLKWGVLVVDNNCTDDTANVVRHFVEGRQISGLRRIVESNQGLVQARLCGVRNTDAPWIAFVDDDCLLDESWLGNAVAFLANHPGCGALGGKVLLDWESPPQKFVKRYTYSFAEQSHGEAECEVPFLVGAGLIVRREAIANSGWVDRPYLPDRTGSKLLSGGDMEMVMRIRGAGYQIWYAPQCSLRHIIPSRRTTQAYLTEINYGLGVSQVFCDLMLSTRQYPRWAASALRTIVKNYVECCRQAVGVALGKREGADVRITLSFAHGRVAGFAKVSRLDMRAFRVLVGCANPRP